MNLTYANDILCIFKYKHFKFAYVNKRVFIPVLCIQIHKQSWTIWQQYKVWTARIHFSLILSFKNRDLRHTFYLTARLSPGRAGFSTSVFLKCFSFKNVSQGPFFSFFYYVCVDVWADIYVKVEDNFVEVWKWSSLYNSPWIPQMELSSPGLCGWHPSMWNHLTSPSFGFSRQAKWLSLLLLGNWTWV